MLQSDVAHGGEKGELALRVLSKGLPRAKGRTLKKKLQVNSPNQDAFARPRRPAAKQTSRWKSPKKPPIYS